MCGQSIRSRRGKETVFCAKRYDSTIKSHSGRGDDQAAGCGEGLSHRKNYVYARYGGIRSLSKLYPGYTVQNEMTKAELRQKLGLPSVYYYLAVFDALGISRVSDLGRGSKVLELIGRNIHLTGEEKHYLRFC